MEPWRGPHVWYIPFSLLSTWSKRNKQSNVYWTRSGIWWDSFFLNHLLPQNGCWNNVDSFSSKTVKPDGPVLFLMLSRILEVKDHMTSVAEWQWMAEGVHPQRFAPSVCRTHKGAWKWHVLFLPGCPCNTGFEEPPFRLLPCSCQELQGCSYTGTEDVCKHGFTLQLFSGCVAKQLFSSCCSCLFCWR